MLLWNLFHNRRKKSAKINANAARRVCIEQLEERTLLSVSPNYLVVDSATPGAVDDANAATHTLYEAITYANAHSNIADIYFADGLDEVTLDAELPEITGNYDLDGSVIKGVDGAADTVRDGSVTIRRDAENAAQFRILTISRGTVNNNVELVGLTISGGNITGNGGGIFNRGALAITNCTISGNTASSYGGGIFNVGRVTVSFSSFIENTLFSSCDYMLGGGICNSGMFMITNSVIKGNSALGLGFLQGGGVYNTNTLIMERCIVSENSVSGEGSNSGGGLCNAGKATITYSSFLNNSALGGDAVSGGGIFNRGMAEVTNSVIAGNFAFSNGGGICNMNTMSVTNCTISQNIAVGINYCHGGGICILSGQLNLYNTIVANNSTDIYRLGGSITAYNNFIGNGAYSGLSNGINGNIVGSDTIPIDPGLGELTKMPNGQLVYPLLANSPCIAAGNVRWLPQGTTTDQGNNPRTSTGTVCIGSVEGGTETPRAAVTYYVTSLDDENISTGGYSFMQAFEAANLNKQVGNAPAGSFTEQDKIVFAEGLTGTIYLDGQQLAVYGNLTIDASSANITINAQKESRVLYVGYGTTVTLNSLKLIGGNTDLDGAGILNFGTISVFNCTISGNTAFRGGAIFNAGVATVVNTTISGNTAFGVRTNSGGGGIYNSTGRQIYMTLINCTVSGNSVKCDHTYGGGIYNLGSSNSLKLFNTIVSRNYALNGISNIHGTWTGSNNLIGYNPWFVNGPVFDGTGKLTNADTLDLHLRTDSPAVNAGNNTYAVADRIYGETVDIGAFELLDEPTACSLYFSVVNTLNDSFDFADDEWSLREAIYWAPEYATITFAEELEGTITLALRQLSIEGAVAINGDNRITIDADKKSSVYFIRTGTSEQPVILNGLTITGGKTSDNGGGINNYYSAVTVTNSTISGNTSSDYGGGIYNSSGTLTVANSTISGNTASYSGGGIYNSGTLTVANSTISGNTASSGGGIYNTTGTICLYNTITSRNYALNGISNIHGTWTGSNNLIGYNPLFVSEPIFDSTGKLTNADTLDLHLRTDSPAVNAGDNLYAEEDRIYGGTVDIGAFELLVEPIACSSNFSVVNTLNDSFDFADDEWSLREAIYWAPEYATITFAEKLEGTITLALGQLCIEGAVAIDGDNRITIDANKKNRGFFISSGTNEQPVVLNGLTITGGNVTDGAGIYIYYGILSVTNSTISGNAASNDGGGICNNYGTLAVVNSTISGNTSSSGGGIYCFRTVITVINSIISDNTANYYGGIFNYYSTLTVTNSTITSNTASSVGGIDNAYGTVNLYNTIVVGNTAKSSGNDLSGTISGSNNLVTGTISGSNNLVYDSTQKLFKDAENGDYRILPGSQAYDAGNVEYATEANLGYSSRDISGMPRISDGTIDIGAYESYMFFSPIAINKSVTSNLTKDNDFTQA